MFCAVKNTRVGGFYIKSCVRFGNYDQLIALKGSLCSWDLVFPFCISLSYYVVIEVFDLLSPIFLFVGPAFSLLGISKVRQSGK